MDKRDEKDSDSDGEEDSPPTLKYLRLTNDILPILKKHPVSSLALHPKFMCVGTAWGSVHLFDHQGNSIRNSRQMPLHSVAINCLDIDERGDYIVSCSDDGFVKVSGFYKDEIDFEVQTGRLVKAVAIDPSYGKPSRRFLVGEERLVLYEKSFLSWKSRIICEAEGRVHSIRWRQQFVAWASNLGVRVYHLGNNRSLGFMKWPMNPAALPQNYNCNLVWNGNMLIIGWVNTVRVCLVRKRQLTDASTADLPEYIVEPQCTFNTDFFVCGIAPMTTPDTNTLQIVILGCSKSVDDEVPSEKPTVFVVQPTSTDYIELARPYELFLKEYENCSVTQYRLEHVLGENRFFIVSPRNIVVATKFDANDQVAWFLKRQMYEEALAIVGAADKYSMQDVGSLYIDHLFTNNEFNKAGELCAKILGHDKKLWEQKVYTLARLQQLKWISAYLPLGDFALDSQVYEMVLYEYLNSDPPGFLELIKKWEPTLYHPSVIIDRLIDQVVISGRYTVTLLEALAILYSHDGKYDEALKIYLKVKNPDIFNMIEKHNLYSSVLDMVVDLVQLDAAKSVALFLDKPDLFPVDSIVKKLQNQKSLLYQYLDALESKNTVLARPYHGQLVGLHADYGRERLLWFLRRSDHYPIQEAFEICQKKNLYPEMVYLLRRMGRSSQALSIMIDQLNDIQQAIEFCKEQDDLDLWKALIQKSLNKPEFISYLLNNIGTAMDPKMLVEKIAPGTVIPGLKGSLTKMMKDYGLQVSVQEDCKRILDADNVNLQSRLIKIQTRGYRVDYEQACGKCNESILYRSSGTTNIIVFFCRHAFHSSCLPNLDRCIVCHAK